MATQYQGTGRRKTSVARVRLVDGSGKFIINKRDMDEYFDYETLKIIAKAPLNIINRTFYSSSFQLSYTVLPLLQR